MAKVHVDYFDSPIKFSFMGIAYPFGGAKEIFAMKGISHLMEHMMCKTFYKDLSQKLNALDISWNAYTSDGRVVFWFSGLTECLEEVADELYGRLVLQTHPLWTQEEFDTEKQTVLQEYKDVFNRQFAGFALNLYRKHYNYYSAIGDSADVEAFTYEDSLRAAELFKRPLKVSLVNLTLKDVETTEGTSDVETNGMYSVEGFKYSKEDVPKLDKTAVLVLSKPVTQNLEAYDFMTTCLNSGFTTPFFDEIREKRGLAYSISSAGAVLNDAFMISGFGAVTSNERAQELMDVFDSLLSTPLSSLVTPEAFCAFKKSVDITKLKLERLPHSGLGPKSLEAFDPLKNIPETYEEFLAICSPMYLRENFTIHSH